MVFGQGIGHPGHRQSSRSVRAAQQAALSDWHNNTGVIRDARERAGMGIILMRPLTSGVFQRLMAEAWATIPVALDIDAVAGDG